jgi:hypothetical protein
MVCKLHAEVGEDVAQRSESHVAERRETDGARATRPVSGYRVESKAAPEGRSFCPFAGAVGKVASLLKPVEGIVDVCCRDGALQVLDDLLDGELPVQIWCERRNTASRPTGSTWYECLKAGLGGSAVVIDSSGRLWRRVAGPTWHRQSMLRTR